MYLHNEIFNRQIWKYFSDDMDSCLAVPKEIEKGNPLFRGGLNYTSALVMFSVIDMLSGYLSGQRSDTSGVTKFLKIYLGKYDDRFRDDNFSRYFYKVFRNGLSHQWEPKHGGIDMFTREQLLYLDGNVIVLSIPVFYEITKKAIKDYEIDLNISQELRSFFEKRYWQIEKEDKKEMDHLQKCYLDLEG